MLKIVTSPDQVCENILKFENELRRSSDMQARLSYARSWYACQDESGVWNFAPAKFAGYQDMDAARYLDEAESEARDGRRTESQLRMFSKSADLASPLQAELTSALFAFLAKYGKTPSMKVRINVIPARRRLPASDAAPLDAHDAVVDLVVAVTKTLPPAQMQRLLAELFKNPRPAYEGTGPDGADRSPTSSRRGDQDRDRQDPRSDVAA